MLNATIKARPVCCQPWQTATPCFVFVRMPIKMPTLKPSVATSSAKTGGRTPYDPGQHLLHSPKNGDYVVYIDQLLKQRLQAKQRLASTPKPATAAKTTSSPTTKTTKRQQPIAERAAAKPNPPLPDTNPNTAQASSAASTDKYRTTKVWFLISILLSIIFPPLGILMFVFGVLRMFSKGMQSKPSQ